MEYIHIPLDILVNVLAGMLASWYYYQKKRRELLGGFWGGAIIGTIGAVLIQMLTSFEQWFLRLVNWLMKPSIGEFLLFRVNLISTIVGAFIFVYILNRINHDRERKY